MKVDKIRIDPYWYACSEPERPTDALVMWHYDDCPACLIKAKLTQKIAYSERESVFITFAIDRLVQRMETGQWLSERGIA